MNEPPLLKSTMATVLIGVSLSANDNACSDGMMCVVVHHFVQFLFKNSQNLPWLTKSLIKLIEKRNLLNKKAKKSGSFRSYKLARNKTLPDIQSAKLSCNSQSKFTRSKKRIGKLSIASTKDPKLLVTQLRQ